MPGEPKGSPLLVTLGLIAGYVTAWVFIDRWQRQPDPQFTLDGIPLLAWYGMGIAGLQALLQRQCTPPPSGRAALLLAVATPPLPLLLLSVGIYYVDARWLWAASAALALYGGLFLARGLESVTGRPQRLAALWGVLFIGGFIAASDALNAIPDLWNPADTTAAAEDSTEPSDDDLAQQESALFEQSGRIDAALAPVQRDPGRSSEGFFLGFAGVGTEKVFSQEIGLAAQVLAGHFDIGPRQLALINDERDLDAAPIASVSGLTYALGRIAARMDLDRDVLFLAISSHGSAEPAIAVSNRQLPLQSLTPEDLAAALRDAGIKWRVIIISACYAGGFVAPLEDAKTIVITAAAADRTSFGCSSDSELTYFGEAFYRDALPAAASLRTAFEAAKVAVGARELREQDTPSNPQAFFGSQIEAKLEALRRR